MFELRPCTSSVLDIKKTITKLEKTDGMNVAKVCGHYVKWCIGFDSVVLIAETYFLNIKS